MNEAKPFEIDKWLIYEAYKKVRSNRGGGGIDGITMEEFDKDLSNNLYRLWNRMSSGSYMPQPVALVDIPKPNGCKRPLGIPTLSDRIAQMAVVLSIMPTLDPIFHEDSYGYRPNKSAHDAIAKARERCFKYAWVLDMDISKFFDTICHCQSESESKCLKEAIIKRFSSCRLALNQEKTKVVLCKSSYRKLDYPETSFDFLGFTFRPRMSMSSKTGRLLTGFSPAISKKSFKKIRETIRSWKLTSKVCKSITELSSLLNPIIQGWINYYSKFNTTEFRKVMNYLNEKLIRWLRRKFKRLRNGYIGRARHALTLTAQKNPSLFAHWACGYKLYMKRVN